MPLTMDIWQASLHIESIFPAVAKALLNLPSHSDGKDRSRSWFPCEVQVMKIGSDVTVRFQPTSHGIQGYEFVRTAPGSEVSWHHAFRVAPGDLHFVAFLLAIDNGLLQLQGRRHSQYYKGRCDTDFHITFGIWLSDSSLHCDTVVTSDLLSQGSVHSEVEQREAFSKCTLQACKAEASRDLEHQHLSPGKTEEDWPFRQCHTKFSILDRGEGSGNDVYYEDSDATINCCKDVETQEIGDQTFFEIESGPFSVAVEEQQTPRSTSQVLLPNDLTKLGTSGSTWQIIPYQSASHSPDRIQQELKRLLQQHQTVNKRDAGSLSMIFVIYLPELDRFKIGSVKQRCRNGKLESAASFREEGCMRRMAQMKKECGYRRIELSYQSEPLATFLIRKVARFVHRALTAMADKIRCLKIEPNHNHIGFFDAEFRVIRYIIEKSLDLLREEESEASECFSLTNSNLKAMDLPQDVRSEMHDIEAVSPGWKHPVNVFNRFHTAVRPESDHHLLDYHPAQPSLEDQQMISHILDTHRLKHEKTPIQLRKLRLRSRRRKDGRRDHRSDHVCRRRTSSR